MEEDRGIRRKKRREKRRKKNSLLVIFEYKVDFASVL
jgi:hypothetical protein